MTDQAENVAALFALGMAHHQAGRLIPASECYTKVLKIEKNHVDAIHLAGVIDFQSGRLTEAVVRYEQALAINPNHPFVLFNLAVAYQTQGKIPQAIESLQQAVRLKPDYFLALRTLGLTLLEQGQIDAAIVCFERAIRLKPDAVDLLGSLGQALKRQGRIDAAITCYREAVRLNPRGVDERNNLGILLHGQGKTVEAIEQYEQLLAIKPDFFPALANLGNALKDQGQVSLAIVRYEEALRLQPNHAAILTNLGAILLLQGRVKEAIERYHHALQIDPRFPGAHYNLANALKSVARLPEAVKHYEIAIDIKPDFVDALSALVAVLEDMGQLDQAVERLRQALVLQPDNPRLQLQSLLLRQSMCDWRTFQDDMRHVTRLVAAQPELFYPFSLFSLPVTLTDQLRSAQVLSDGKKRGILRYDHLRPMAQPQRIRLGYLSVDFREHAVASLIVELFERHDRTRFEIFGYSYGPDDGSLLRQRLAAACDHFIDVSPLTHNEVAARIRQDEIHILIDLTGYTTLARPDILFYRPAPVQATYLGFTGSMGTDVVDYIIADDVVVPMAHQSWYAEKIVHLPETYQPNDTTRLISDHTPTREECGLPEHGIVFCCFNNSYKITPTFFHIWLRLLQRIPGSVLWLSRGNAWVQSHLREVADAWGVAPQRLIFAPRCPSMADHLARQRQADLFLDTLPFNAHTTASDALWAGLPVVTCLGDRFAGRVAASLLRAAGLSELITTSLADYEALILTLATEPTRLAALKDTLGRSRYTMPLFNIERTTRHLEAAYAQMWQTWCLGRPPTAFAVPPL